jgi:hypothetical protein
MNQLSLSALPIHLDYYLTASEQWAAVLAHFQLTEQSTVVEISPGWAPKIPLALYRQGFAGKYIGYDLSREALAQLQQFMEMIPAKFTAEYQCGDVLQSPLPPADMLVMNHVIDDLLLGRYGQLKSYESVAELQKSWQALAQLPLATFQPLVKQLATNITNSLHQNGQLLLHQYPGYIETLHHLPAAWELTRVVTQQLVQTLLDNHQADWHRVDLSSLLKLPSAYTPDTFYVLTKN